VHLILQKLRRHQEAARIRDDVDLDAIAYSISALGFSVGFVYQVCFGDDRALARRVVTGSAEAIAEGVTPKEQPLERTRP
jgi:hypothetical protein